MLYNIQYIAEHLLFIGTCDFSIFLSHASIYFDFACDWYFVLFTQIST